MKIISVVGARPNFMKIAAFAAAIKTHNLNGLTPYIHHKIIHTGQHYDERMTDVFFKALSIPEPDMNLQIGSGTHAEQVGYTMIAFTPFGRVGFFARKLKIVPINVKLLPEPVPDVTIKSFPAAPSLSALTWWA